MKQVKKPGIILIALLLLIFIMPDYVSLAQDRHLNLIPLPQKVEFSGGKFTFSPGYMVYLLHPDDSAVLFPVNQFFREVKAKFGFYPQYNESMKKSAIVIGERGWEKKFDKLTETDTSALKKCGQEGYILKVSPKRLILAANTDTGVFYGIQTLNQLIRANALENAIPCVTIVDWPALKYRGWQDDISRGPIPGLAYLKEEIRKMSAFKMNAFTLYTENVFKLKCHPDIAPDDGITAEEIKTLSEYARKYHVELIGNFQAFGHFGKILEKPAYSHLAETPKIISPAFPGTYKLLGDIIGEIATAYDSKLFNINCDEVFGLGSGPAKTMVDTMGLAGLYAWHINKLADILKPYHKTIMMWGDIARDYPDIIQRLPKDIIVLLWAYQAAPSFRAYIEPFKKAGLTFWICPGVSCWNRIFPDLKTAEINIAHFVRDGYEMEAQGMLNTTWDDDGENLFGMNWFPLAWGAECAWKPVISEDDSAGLDEKYYTFTRSFDPVFFGSKTSVAEQIIQLSNLRKHSSAGNLSDGAFWQPMIGKKSHLSSPERHISDALSLEQESSALIRSFEEMKNKVKYNKKTIDYLIFAAKRAEFMARKNELRYQLNDPVLRKRLRADEVIRRLSGLANVLKELKKQYIILWNRENMPWWLDKNLAKYDRLTEDLKNTPYHIFIHSDTAYFSSIRRITLKSLLPADKIFYTLDGSDPDTSSAVYAGMFTINKPGTVKARSFSGGRLNPVFIKNMFVYRGPVKNITLSSAYAKRYGAHGVVSLVDSVYGTKNFHDGNWLGFEGKDFEATLEFKQPLMIDTITVTFLQNSSSWILFPEWVAFYVSEDGENYIPVGKIENSIPWKKQGTYIEPFTCVPGNKEIRYVRIHARNTGTLPAWHKTAGGKAWVFTDEIMLK